MLSRDICFKCWQSVDGHSGHGVFDDRWVCFGYYSPGDSPEVVVSEESPSLKNAREFSNSLYIIP